MNKQSKKAITHEVKAASVVSEDGNPTGMMLEGLPDIGKWIQWNFGTEGSELKGVVLDYTTLHKKWPVWVQIKYISGVEQTALARSAFVSRSWSYCEIPSEEEIEGLNIKIGNRFCNMCKCVAKKLQICTGCYKVYYCDATCQADDWNNHKKDCKRDKTVLKPDPRYPLSEISNEVKQRQIKIQNECHQFLQDALNGNFSVKSIYGDCKGTVISNPKSGSDLENGKYYILKINNKEMRFLWLGLEAMDHSIPEGNPTTCHMLESMEDLVTEDLSICLHFLAQYIPEGSINYSLNYFKKMLMFLSMVINYNTFGTVAPYYGPCKCLPQNVKSQMPPERRELRKKWNKIFKRAKANICDVQCLFSDSEEGCHNYNNCQYMHDVEVKKEKKK